MSRKWMIDAIGKMADVEPNIIDLSPGDDIQAWSEIKNIRLEVDGYNVFWKPRGGALHMHTFSSVVITTYCFHARIAGVLNTYVAAHCDNGIVYLYDVDANTEVIVDTDFDSTTPIQIHNIGTFLYLFSASDSRNRIYNISSGVISTWNSIQAKPITAYSWVTGGDFRVENLWGFRNDEAVLKIINFFSEGTTVASASGGILAPNTAYRFTIGGNKPVVIAGTTYSNTQIYVNGATPTGFTLGSGSGTPLVTPLLGVPVIDGQIQMRAFHTKIEKIYEDGTVSTDKNQFGTSQMALVNSNQPILPDTPDLQAFFGSKSLYRYLDATVIINPDYVDPVLYRAYAVIDIAFDGSISLIGRPIVVSTTATDIMLGSVLSRRGVQLTLPVTDNVGVLKRVLIATRWQATEDDALIPTSERYPNSPFFIVKDVGATATSVTDFTADRLLIRPVTEFIPTIAGVPVIYSRDSIKPSTTAAFKGAILIGGYTVNRQIPRPYTDTGNSANGNVYIKNIATTDLAYKISVIFEYGDGSYSNVVDSGVAFQLANSGGAAFASFASTVETPAAANWTAFINFDIYTIAVSVLNLDSETTIATKIAAAMTANASFNTQWTATSLGADILITSQNEGSAYNDRAFSISTGGFFSLSVETGVTSGGADADTTYKTFVHFHNMNAEISSVILLAKADAGGTYGIIGRYPVVDPRANGKAVAPPGTPADMALLPAYTIPSGSKILETVYLQNFLETCVPPQNPRFDAQAQLVSSGEIMSIIPISYDSDRASILRYRLLVLTDQDVQVGYLVEQQTSTGIIYEANLEVIDSDTRAMRSYGATRILDTVYFQSNLGLSAVTGSTVKLIVERERYSLFSGIVESMTYNKRHGELWVQFDAGGTLLVIDLASGEVRQDTYDGFYDIASIAWSDETLVATAGPVLLSMDNEGSVSDALFGSLTGTVDTNAWTFGNLSFPFEITDGTTFISITTINDGGFDTVEAIAANIAQSINASAAFKATAFALGAVIRFAPKETCTLLFSGEPEFTLSATPFLLSVVPYQMSALTKPLTTQLEQIKVLELSLMGQAISCVPSFDFQRPRLESIAGTWSKTFNAELTESSKALTMAGASWQIHRRGIKPRILLTFTPSSGAFVETIRLKAEGTPNIGKARQ